VTASSEDSLLVLSAYAGSTGALLCVGEIPVLAAISGYIYNLEKEIGSVTAVIYLVQYMKVFIASVMWGVA
jgi:hypothetical protein